MQKTALAGYDIKRSVLNDNIHILPHGHYKFKINNRIAAEIDWEDDDIAILQERNENDNTNDINWEENIPI